MTAGSERCYGVEEFDRVRLKKDALQILEGELEEKEEERRCGSRAMSDTYNPFEEEMEATRGA